MQIRVASGEPFWIKQKEIKISGHAIECRINAEDPETFRPSPGTIVDYYTPGGNGVRIDSNVYNGYSVLPYYDSMIAKLIVSGETREEAIARMRRSLDEFIIYGINTTIPLHQKIMEHFAFVENDLSTDFIDRYFSK
jgi:acetyl-CoA carboxylase biotin carboxylase subunit